MPDTILSGLLLFTWAVILRISETVQPLNLGAAQIRRCSMPPSGAGAQTLQYSFEKAN